MNAPESDLLVARAVILWPWRVKNGVVRLDDPHHRKDLYKHFERHVRADDGSELRKIDGTDLEQAFLEFAHRFPALGDWYRAIFEALRLEIDWRADGPVVPVSSFGAWTKLGNEFEADALLAFDLASRPVDGEAPDAAIARQSGWLTCVRAGDAELEALFADGLSDMHVHVGGVRLPHPAWLELMQSTRSPIAYTSLPECYKDMHRDFHAEMTDARRARAEIARRLGRDAAEALPRPTREHWWSWHPSNLSHERALLLGAWSKVISRASGSDVLAVQLDRYLDCKHRFFARVREPAFDAVPGLQYFTERYFRALDRRPARSRWKESARYGASRRLEMAPYGDACQYLLESRHLERVELRIAPFNRAPDYWRFFTLWKELKRAIDLAAKDRPKVDIRFAVHFKRSRDKSTRRNLTNTLTRLSELDRHTAVLRVALACPQGDELRKHIKRVDVAGHERDTSVSLFSWHLRLLRGDCVALEMLERDRFPPPWRDKMAAWRRLSGRGLHRLPTRALELTLHAGEAFSDRLDGLFEIGTAIDMCGLSSGHGIGHGLVLAQPAAGLRTKATPQGEVIDQLCWLHDTLKQSHPDDFRALRERLHGPIEEQARVLYKDFPDVAGAVKAGDLLWLWRIKSGGEKDWQERALRDRFRGRLLALESDERFIAVRDKPKPVPERGHLDDIVEGVREWLLRRVIDRHIVVELNPSSNLRISSAGSTAANPPVALMQAMADGLMTCVNTDNPGVFMSCIENEYALLLDGLEGCGIDRHKIDGWLEMARHIGRNVLK